MRRERRILWLWWLQKTSTQLHAEKEDGVMRIAIPLDENQQDVCIVLARAPYFLFREDGGDTIVENPAAQAQGGAGL